ncbi:MAG: hypothetical protein PHY93_21625, partial [Bacteriovorax sp.]|nr:hypothetical protein [Bacteriovorax sp.]
MMEMGDMKGVMKVMKGQEKETKSKMDSKFWDDVYESKSEDGVSWYQEAPKRSFETVLSLNLPKTAKIIDVGGGRSKLSEYLYEKSFKD